MSSLVQLPSQPSSAFQLDFDAVRNFQNVPPVDLEGGTLIDATEVRIFKLFWSVIQFDNFSKFQK